MPATGYGLVAFEKESPVCYVTGTTYVSQLRHKSTHTHSYTHTFFAHCPPTRFNPLPVGSVAAAAVAAVRFVAFPKPHATRHAGLLLPAPSQPPASPPPPTTSLSIYAAVTFIGHSNVGGIVKKRDFRYLAAVIVY